jgi:tetratricopeptide (TPR) repeat protein
MDGIRWFSRVAVDKQKALDSAQKFLQKGQIDKAILEYRKVCEADPEDMRSLQKLGDLYARQGSRQEAVATYMKLAEQLTARGFANRAVSIYKQVLQLNPLLVPVYVKLSELFMELGLSKDARIFNQRAIEILQKTGNQDDLLALLRRVVEGDPEDAISRINLAETYLRVGDTADAIRELEASLPLLREQKLDDLFIRAAERLLYHNPDNTALCKELAVLHLRRREVPRAMKLLLFCRKKEIGRAHV